jgi:hypothetical protein
MAIKNGKQNQIEQYYNILPHLIFMMKLLTFQFIEHLEFFKLLTIMVIMKKNIVILRYGKQKTLVNDTSGKEMQNLHKQKHILLLYDST